MTNLKLAEREDDTTSIDIGFLLNLDDQAATDKELFKIGDLSKEFGVTLRTLRFYEDRGLLAP